MPPWTVILGVLWFLGLALGISVLWTGPAGALWLPTSRRVVRQMLYLADVQPGETVYDLGSGDGRVLFIAAREFGARAVGIELDPLRYLWTRLWIALLGLRGQVRVVLGNFFNQDVSEANVIVTYLVPKAQKKLMFKLWRELAPGSRVVSSIFVYPGWEPRHVDRKAHLFLYDVAEYHKEYVRSLPAGEESAQTSTTEHPS
ncbi:MAG: class I SAM-dependent methyltransferase [Anaerolineae bacterium]|nr:class I SAM-dependent methyltransferase [Anaerolineae bacterium]